MKNRPGSNDVVSDWGIDFDANDSNFCNASASLNPMNSNPPTIVVGENDENIVNEMCTFSFKVPSANNNMSLASVHGPQFTDICSPLGRNSMSSSLSDLVGSPLEIAVENVLTIEELRTHMGSCFTCGVSWTDEHISLDCAECGDYSTERPCPLCDGQCGVQWKRDFTMSHASGKARWQGVCPSYPEATLHLNAQSGNMNNITTTASTQATCASASSNQLRLAQELCARLEQLSASAK